MAVIPKIIHYCWFGKGEMNQVNKSCIKSWHKYAKDYVIKEWNEDNFDVNINPYVKEAYTNKSWAFVSDYVRIYVLYNEGGIYLDTDVELKHNLDEFLKYPFFVGMQSDNEVQTALIGAGKKNNITKLILDYYQDKHFINNNNEFDYRTNNSIITRILIENYELILKDKKQNLMNQVYIFPTYFFTIKKYNMENYAVHYFNASWVPRELLIKEMKNYKINYNICLKWLENNINGFKFSSKLNKYSKIAVYGLGYLGRMFIKQSEIESINIKFIIDNKAMNENYNGLRILKPYQLKNIDIDLIIVTPVADFENIKNKLLIYTKSKIINLNYILHS
ncbi:glycosyltransferase family 32 protein [Clostridium tyrobutyricum]|uniref:glycosyltransferase family 32 protein n=1 Tax=Clostridium tyrobutyricum TaxID=1519 RepID=UPI001C38B7A4|nr:glycosyltransferase [Clostridium tyrobutyricum]MBV4428306.1 glycosyl transferase [Clostridium tyrobutyricum]MBV4443296.1 glycosyl transferase [Clostridium tyrobutyricum]